VLWIGTLNGLYTFDGFRLSRVFIKDAANQPLPFLKVVGLEADTSDQNLLFVCTDQGLLAINPIDHRIVPDSAMGLPPGFFKSCTQIEKSSTGFYWLLSGQSMYKLVKIAPNRFKYHFVDFLPAAKFSRLQADPFSPEGVWILPPSMEAYYLDANGLEHFILPENKSNPSPDPGVIQWLYIQKGIIGWDRARNIYRVNSGLKRIELVNNEYNLYDFLPEVARVDHYMEQKPYLECYASILAGQEVIGTSLGLFFVRKKMTRFHIIEPLRGAEIRGIYADTSGKWWAGSYSGLFDGQLNHYPVSRSDPGGVWGFLPIEDNLFLLAVERPSGIVGWSRARKKQVSNPVILSQLDQSAGKLTGLTICKDKQGTIWAGTYSHLLWASATQPYQFNYWLDASTGKPMGMRFVRAIIPDKNSGIWVGSENGLLHIVYNAQKQHYEIDTQVPSLKGVVISGLYQDRHQQLWIATKGMGIACLDLKNLRSPPRWYNSENGLCNNFTCRIESSHNDEVLWISTHNGLSRFDVKSGTFHNFYEESGFPGNEFNSAASAKFPDGTLMFGGVSGLIHFHPDSIPTVDFQHKTILSGASYYDQESKQLSTLSISPHAALSLPSYPEYFELRLGSTEFIEPDKVRFRYRLHGLSELWTYVSGEGEVKFIRLGPGNYVFEAQAISLDGHHAQPVWLTIYVATPYYETWWFKTLLVAFSLGIGYLAYLYRVRRLLHEQHMRQQLADDLHDDIGNKLSIISIMAQKMAKAQTENVAQILELNKLMEVNGNALRSLHTMIWSVDSKKDRLSSLFDRMQDFADGYLRPLGIKFQFDLKGHGSNRNIHLQARHHIIMIYQELLTNMVKYTHPTLIAIRIELHRDTLHLHIINHHQTFTTPGFGAISSNRGLSSIERRLNRIKGKYTWVEPSDDRQEIHLVVPYVFKGFLNSGFGTIRPGKTF